MAKKKSDAPEVPPAEAPLEITPEQIAAKVKESAYQLTYGDARRILEAQAAHDAAQG
jgi:hypothetical protein